MSETEGMVAHLMLPLDSSLHPISLTATHHDLLCVCCSWAAYNNSKYPWIKVASGYNVVAHYPADGSIATFEVPSDLPSGKYILHWWWRGFLSLKTLTASDLNLFAQAITIVSIRILLASSKARYYWLVWAKGKVYNS